MRGRRNIQSVDTLYGGFWTRFVAWIIDAIILSVVLATIRLAAQGFEQITSDALFSTVVCVDLLRRADCRPRADRGQDGCWHQGGNCGRPRSLV